MTMAQPSISGDGTSVAVVETSGTLSTLFTPPPARKTLAVLSFTVSASGTLNLNLSAVYLGDITEPSLDYAGDIIMFQELFGGDTYLSTIDLTAGSLTDLLVADVDHPFITADGDYFSFSYGGDAYVAAMAGGLAPLSP